MMTLPCGCDPGFFYCKEAESLWQEALKLMRTKGTDNEEYQEARRLYDSHTELTPEMIAARLGRKGGQSTSEAKVSASRANGKLGGRPKKPIVILD